MKIADLNGIQIDCSSFVQVKTIGEMKVGKPVVEGLRSEFVFASEDGVTYEGPTPAMVQRNALGFLQREQALASARKRGYRWNKKASTESGLAVVS